MEKFVIRKNIELYRRLLVSAALDEPRRLVIAKLLAEEELKLQQLLNEKGG